MPSLTDVYLGWAFYYKNDVTIRGSTHFIPLSRIDIGHLSIYLNVLTLELYQECMDIIQGSGEISNLVIGGSSCPFANVTTFDLSVYPSLKSLSVGGDAFKYVNELIIIGLSELESVEIGETSFTKHKDLNPGQDPNRHFYLKNCPKLKSLKMGRFSFSDYSVCEIENVDALEVIEMGELNERSYNFMYASLELKSLLIHSE